jgi:hypothetical protein
MTTPSGSQPFWRRDGVEAACGWLAAVSHAKALDLLLNHSARRSKRVGVLDIPADWSEAGYPLAELAHLSAD